MPGTAPGSGPASRLHLFGPMRIVTGDGPAALTGANTQRLVGYLGLHPRVAHRREALADALWPDAGAAARRSLSDTLYRLRRHGRDQWLDATGDTIALAGEDWLWVDVWEFDRLADGDSRTDWERAIALY